MEEKKTYILKLKNGQVFRFGQLDLYRVAFNSLTNIGVIELNTGSKFQFIIGDLEEIVLTQES
jgi:hypothetical protein